MECSTKYPKTYHLPFSKGLTNDDRMVDNDWEKYLINQPIVITEKLDGSQNCITKHGVYARSHTTFSENKWDTNLIEKGGLYDQIKDNLTDDMYVYIENMYAIHSIEYNKLPSYTFLIAYREGDYFESWNETEWIARYFLSLKTVPVLYQGKVHSIDALKKTIEQLMRYGSKYGNTIEGVVIRNTKKFHYNDFSKYVAKYVRENHVQTDKHWRKNWKKHQLYYEYEYE